MPNNPGLTTTKPRIFFSTTKKIVMSKSEAAFQEVLKALGDYQDSLSKSEYNDLIGSIAFHLEMEMESYRGEEGD